MKYITIFVDPLKVKGDLDDMDQLRQDVYDKLQSMMESETLEFTIGDDGEDDEDPFL